MGQSKRYVLCLGIDFLTFASAPLAKMVLHWHLDISYQHPTHTSLEFTIINNYDVDSDFSAVSQFPSHPPICQNNNFFSKLPAVSPWSLVVLTRPQFHHSIPAVRPTDQSKIRVRYSQLISHKILSLDFFFPINVPGS